MNNSTKLRTALVAVGGSLAAIPAAALELGDVRVHSTLGQPLRASIAYALAPNEAISDTCVSLLPGATASGLPVVSHGSMIVADGVIAITGSAIVREPLVSMRVSIRCAYTPQLTREYMMFIDPAATTPQPARAPVSAPVEVPAVSRRVEPAPQPAARRSETSAEPIANASRYLVQPGDSLSEIAQRIENRPVGLWPAVNAIFAANPAAFMDNDINKLKAGTWLTIPDLGAGKPLTVAAPTVADAASSPVQTPSPGTAYEPESTTEAVTPVSEPVSILDTSSGAAATDPVPVQEEAGEPAAELEPGDVILNPIESVADDNIVIPDTALEGPVATSSQPNVPTAIIRPAEPVPRQSTNWLAWFVGGGIALIAGLLLFGWFRGRFGSTPVGAAGAQTLPPEIPEDTQRIEAMDDVDYDLDDDSPTAENLALDADLVLGTGLEAGTDVEVVEQFAFADTTSLDLELPEEMSSNPDKPETDIIPPLNIDPESILESEVLPDADDIDDYDMSVIVDATKMPDPEDVTERDLEAIEVPDDDETLITGDYTVSHEVDYKILEQDYEDELTATQRLNEEIQKAAEDLATRIDDDTEEKTKEMSMATVHELDVTAQMHGRNDDEIGDDDDTGVNPTVEIDAEDKTVEMADEKTVEMSEDNTVEMPKRGKAG